jgi:hypothetical protein
VVGSGRRRGRCHAGISVTLQKVVAVRGCSPLQETALLNAAEHELDAAEHELLSEMIPVPSD